jgi:glutaredoxin
MRAAAIFRRTQSSTFTGALVAAALACGASIANAQTVFRIVGPDGKVTFSDKRPATADEGKLVGTGVGAKGDASGTALPFELRQVVGKYPVVLYTSTNCAPCDTGRTLLNGRGVPFTERTISTLEDTEALQRLSGENSLPFLTIGSQKIKGMSDLEWKQYLDAAGYPKASLLPAAYKNPAPVPLVSVQKATAEPKAQEKPAVPEVTATTPPPPAFNPANPAGIQF